MTFKNDVFLLFMIHRIYDPIFTDAEVEFSENKNEPALLFIFLIVLVIPWYHI